MSDPTPSQITRLEAVNQMLIAGQQTTISTLSPPYNALVGMAINILDFQHKTALQAGWTFNTSERVNLVPDVDGYINLTSDILKVVCKCDSRRPVESGQKLKDRRNNTFLFTSKVIADLVVYAIPFSDCPEAYKTFITVRSARKFLDAYPGDSTLRAFSQQDEAAALANVLEYETDVGDYTIFDSYDTARGIRDGRRY